MTGPATARIRPPISPLRGAEWFAARLALALRRTRRFTRWWIGIGGALTFLALLLPLASGDPQSPLREALDRAAADTLRASARVRDLQGRVSLADSSLATARVAARAMRRYPPRIAARLAPPAAAAIDPRLSSLERALEAARRDRSVPMTLALADEPLVRYGPRMRAFADSLRRTTDATEVRRLSITIIEMAESRVAAFGSTDGGRSTGAFATDRIPLSDEQGLRPDTAVLQANASALRDSLQRARHTAVIASDSLHRLGELLRARREAVPPIAPALVLLIVLVLGMLARVASVLMHEMRAPTLAHGMEAERAVGAPALALVRDGVPEGPLRFRPHGVDAFRVLYLGLTSTGTRARAVVVTGEDALIAGAAAARLAIAAAADHRKTLVAEMDAEQAVLARIFREHAEPGFTDALVGAFPWSEVVRPVGSSDGLTIQLLPAGTSRALDTDLAVRDASRGEFDRFRNGFEFTILVVALGDLPAARDLLPGAPTVLCGTLGQTPVARFAAAGARIQAEGETLHSVVVWDAPRPVLPSLAELAAILSNRKNRQPRLGQKQI